jgi:valyl-tRNA synthetase
MIFQGIGCTGKKPFSDIYLHPLIADPESGTKMSKSKGNVKDLLQDLATFGTDAFRFAISASIIPSSYMMLPESRIQGYKNFANKLWNASRFVLMNLEGMDTDPKDVKLELCDKWILSRYNSVVQEVTNALDAYRFDEAAQTLYDFIWHEYCDWYLELVKIRMYNKEDAVGKQSAQYVLWQVLEGLLRLLHPMMPFITEEIWQHLPHEGESIMVAEWPKSVSNLIDKKSESDMIVIMDVIRAVRNILSEMNIPPSSKADIYVQVPDDNIKALLSEQSSYIYRLGSASNVIVERNIAKPASSATVVINNGVEVYVPKAGLIDIDKEKERLTKNLDKAIADLDRVNNLLAGEAFISKAPENIIAKEKNRKAEIEALKEKLEKNLEMLA